MEEQSIVKNSVLKIFRQCGVGDVSKMTQRDFEFVSAEIEKKTGIVLSSTTLKRLANGDFSRLPQVATLNAVAKYLGFENWVAYKYKATEEGPAAVVEKRRGSVVRPLALILLIALVTMAFFMTRNKPGLGSLNDVTFSARTTTDNNVPNTVVFNYNIDNVDADSFFIQQSWDKNRRVRVYKDQYTVTDIYYEPGFHLAKLIANDSIIREIEVSIPSDRWMFYANEQKMLYRTEYVTDVQPASGTMGLSIEDLERNDIDTKEDKVYIYSYFPTEHKVPGDDFTLKTRVRMKDVKNVLCPFIELEIFCQRNYQIIKTFDRGCAAEAFVIFGDKTIDGNRNNLEDITFNVKEWNEIELMVVNKNVTLKINGVVALETSYARSTKNIAGLAFISNGLCEVDYVDLSGLDGEVVVKDDFSAIQ